MAGLIEKSGEAVDPPTTKRDENPKHVPEAVLGVIPVADLDPFLDDEIFMLDFKDRLKSIIRRISAELAVVDTDLRFHELISLFKVAPKAISACSMRYPKSEAQWEDWQDVIIKKYQIKDVDVDNPPPRKYEDKKPDLPDPEQNQDTLSKKSKKTRSKKQSKAASRPGGTSKGSKPVSRQPAEDQGDEEDAAAGEEDPADEGEPEDAEGF